MLKSHVFFSLFRREASPLKVFFYVGGGKMRWTNLFPMPSLSLAKDPKTSQASAGNT